MRTTAPRGMTLIEALAAIAIFAIVSVSLYTIVTVGVKLVRDDQARLDAVSIAQSIIEQIHNVPYDDIGTVSGIPAGSFAQTQTQVHNKTTYTIATDIRYVDDAFDGVAPTDTISTDYKKIRVAVTWEGQYVEAPVVLVTTIAPEGIETAGAGGTLWVQVYDSSTNPITNATVHITNSTVSPAVDVTSSTDSTGGLMLPGTPESVQGYHVVVSKSGYSSTQTYSTDATSNPNPDPSDLSVATGEVTQKIFYIDRVSSLAIHVQDLTSTDANSGVDVRVVGSNRIGTALDGSDIPKYDVTTTTDSSGDITLSNLEYDTYAITIDDTATGFDLAGMSNTLPYVLAPNTSASITLQTNPNTTNTLLITAHTPTGSAVEGASVELTDSLGAVVATQTTDVYGQTFFSSLSAGSYTVTVTSTGNETFQDSFDVTDDIEQVIPLTPSA